MKITPEDIITLDMLIYFQGSQDDIQTWDKFKKEFGKLAHKDKELLNNG